MCFDVSLPEPRLAASEECRLRPSVARDSVASDGWSLAEAYTSIVVVYKL